MATPLNPLSYKKSLISGLERGVSLGASIIASGRVDTGSYIHNVASLLAAGVVDSARSSVLLLRSGHFNAVPKVIRPITEYTVDLINLSNDDEYCEAILYKSCESEYGNMYKLLACSHVADDNEQYEKANCKLETIAISKRNTENGKYSKYGRFDKYKLAGLELAYRILYSHYSGNIHGTIYSLEESYGIAENGKFSDINKAQKTEWLAVHSELISLCLGRTIKSMTSICGWGKQNRIDKFHRTIQKCMNLAKNPPITEAT